MSHSTFKEFDDEISANNNEGNNNKAADTNLIVFINKEGDVSVDHSALQDLIVNANSDKKTTVSVIRVESPTPSMESSKDASDRDDGEAQDELDKSNDDSEAENSDESNNEQIRKKKSSVPRFSLTVENFYNPQQAKQFASEIMSKAGITNPMQLIANKEFLRYTIENDHCYTPLTYADEPNYEDPSAEKANKNDNKNNKTLSKVVSKVQQIKIGATKSGRVQIKTSVESEEANASNADDTGSGLDEDRGGSEEEGDSESELSDSSLSESDNDRDSDLDFSVNDYQSRRTRKISRKKKAAKALKKLGKKQRNVIDSSYTNDASDDNSANQKKAYKLPKKSVTNKIGTTTSVPASTTASAMSKNKRDTASRAPKSSQIKEDSLHDQNDTMEQQTDKNSVITNNEHSGVPPLVRTTSIDPVTKTKSIIQAKKDKKQPAHTEALFSDMSSLFSTPDVIKKVGNMESPKITSSQMPLLSTTKILNPTVTSSGFLVTLNQNQNQKVHLQLSTQTPIRPHALNAVSSPSSVNAVSTTTPGTVPALLASEQDKQLDLIDSIVQEELKNSTPASSPTKTVSLTSIQHKPEAVSSTDIPNIVKMLENPEVNIGSPPSRTAANIIAHSTNTIDSPNPMSHVTTSLINDSQILPEDLLEGFANSDDLTEDLLQHVAQLVEDKNVQEVLDKQVIGVTNSITNVSSPSSLSSLTVLSNQQTDVPEKESPFVRLARQRELQKAAAAAAPQRGKEPIRIIRNGRVITLPPIEAPTTRGAKRRAQNPATPVDKSKIKTPPSADILESPKNTPPNPMQDDASFSVDKLGKTPPLTGKLKERRSSVAVKRVSSDTRKRSLSTTTPPGSVHDLSKYTPFANDDDYEDDEEGSDGSYNSEDDPNRLWCICRRPHNNRFMICCDKCEEWFHGQCVNVTKQMGKEMEQRGIEWICPNCIKKTQPSIKNIFPRKSSIDMPKQKEEASDSGSTCNCVVCKKPARSNSIYCSDDCIRKHADTTTSNSNSVSSSNSHLKGLPKIDTQSKLSDSENKISKVPIKSPTVQKGDFLKNKKNHIIVYDKKNRRYLSGNNAPTVENYRQWLQEHPNFEIVRSGTEHAAAFRAKQEQLKKLALGIDNEKVLFSVSQPPKVQTTLKLDADKKIIYVNPSNHKQSSGHKKPTTPTQTKPSSKSDSPSHTKHVSKTATTPNHKTPQSAGNSSSNKKRQSENRTPSSSSNSNSTDRDQIRDSVRKTLADQLTQRTTEITDRNTPRLTADEIKEFAENTEAEIYATFGNDTNNKYRAKYRSLMFNIKDRKNQTLFQKISNKAIQPKQLVRMSPEELASQELAKWRENENKHQLEMITKSELDMLACTKSYVLKTHKGEEVIESSTDRVTLDPSTAVQDVVSVLNNANVSSTETGEDINASTPIIVKDNRFEKYLSVDSSSNASSGSGHKSSSNNSKKKDGRGSRDHHDHSRSSSKHKRKKSRDRDRHSRSGERDKDERKDKEKNRDRDKDRNREKKDSHHHHDHHSDGKKKDDKKDHRSTSKTHHHDSTKEKKPEKESSTKLTPKIVKKEENYSLIDKILEAQSTIDRIVNADNTKNNELKSGSDIHKTETISKLETSNNAEQTRDDRWSASVKKYPLTTGSSESDQEPSSTVTIPTPPEYLYQTERGEIKERQIFWNGTLNMVDVATFNISASVFNGDSTNLGFPEELDIVGRIKPDIVWDYIGKIKPIKDVIVIRFTPMSKDDEMAYDTLLKYLDTRRRHGVIKPNSDLIKDFYIFPLAAHKSLPTVLQSPKGSEFEPGRPDLLIGIIVPVSKRNPVPAVNRIPSLIGTKPTISRQTSLLSKDADLHYTPPTSPDLSIPQLKSKTGVIEDGDEPYSPEDSDDDDTGNAIPFLGSIAKKPALAPAPNLLSPTKAEQDEIQRKMDELNRQIEAQKKEIAMYTGDIDEPYSPTNSVSPPHRSHLSDHHMSGEPIVSGLANICIPENLADILNSIKSKSTSGNDSTTQFVTTSSTIVSSYTSTDSEYIPIATIPPPLVAQSLIPSTSSSMAKYQYTTFSQQSNVSDAPSRLAQLTDDELMRLVPDDSLIDIAPPPTKKSKFEDEPPPPGLEEDEEYKP